MDAYSTFNGASTMQGIKITSAGFGGRIQPNKNGTINTITLNEFLPTLKGWKRLLLVKADVEVCAKMPTASGSREREGHEISSPPPRPRTTLRKNRPLVPRSNFPHHLFLPG